MNGIHALKSNKVIILQDAINSIAVKALREEMQVPLFLEALYQRMQAANIGFVAVLEREA